MDMRQLITLLEDTTKLEFSLQGNVDITGLARLLPHVTDLANFTSGFNKLKNNEGDLLNGREKNQFALAFISILGLDRQTRTQVMSKLSDVGEIPVKTPTTPT